MSRLPRRRRVRARRLTRLRRACALIVGPALLTVLGACSTPAEAPAPTPLAGVGPHAGAERVLDLWDRRRATAWSAGDAAALEALYVPGADAGRRDAALLRRYLEAGSTVRFRMQRFAIAVVRREPGRLVVEVEDRVVGARAVAVPGGLSAAARTLPEDTGDRNRVELRHHAAYGWRVVSVVALS